MASNEDRDQKLGAIEKLFESFKAGGTDADPLVTEEAAKKLIIDYLARLMGVDEPSANKRDEIWNRAVGLMKSFDPDAADLAYSAKLLRLLATAQDGKTIQFMESLVAHKAEEERQKQIERGKVTKKKDPLTQFIADAITHRPDISLEELWTRMEYVINEGVICSIDPKSVEYYKGKNSETKIVSKQAVATRLSNQKKKD